VWLPLPPQAGMPTSSSHLDLRWYKVTRGAPKGQGTWVSDPPSPRPSPPLGRGRGCREWGDGKRDILSAPAPQSGCAGGRYRLKRKSRLGGWGQRYKNTSHKKWYCMPALKKGRSLRCRLASSLSQPPRLGRGDSPGNRLPARIKLIDVLNDVGGQKPFQPPPKPNHFPHQCRRDKRSLRTTQQVKSLYGRV
jgi:hypothetical protein